jgi:hypothetical protein
LCRSRAAGAGFGGQCRPEGSRPRLSSNRAITAFTLTACAFGNDDLANRALVDGLDLRRRLVGLDLASTSPDDLVAFLCHFAMPSVIVGDSAGIRISSA